MYGKMMIMQAKDWSIIVTQPPRPGNQEKVCRLYTTTYTIGLVGRKDKRKNIHKIMNFKKNVMQSDLALSYATFFLFCVFSYKHFAN
jgi:hypothetical protein